VFYTAPRLALFLDSVPGKGKTILCSIQRPDWLCFGILFPARVRQFCVLYSAQTGSVAYPVSYTMNVSGSSMTTRLQLLQRIRMADLCIHCAMRFHGVVLR
jgi:hypothetical protein